MQFKWGFPGGVGGIAVLSALPPRPPCDFGRGEKGGGVKCIVLCFAFTVALF